MVLMGFVEKHWQLIQVTVFYYISVTSDYISIRTDISHVGDLIGKLAAGIENIQIELKNVRSHHSLDTTRSLHQILTTVQLSTII